MWRRILYTDLLESIKARGDVVWTYHGCRFSFTWQHFLASKSEETAVKLPWLDGMGRVRT